MFKPLCSALLIGSFPLKSHEEAIDLCFKYTPEIPAWPQLPSFKEENMILQFLPGMPGFEDDTILAKDKDLEKDLIDFYQDYLEVKEKKKKLSESRFVLNEEAKGFHLFVKRLKNCKRLSFKALKGQITGPFTFASSLKDEQKRSILYNDQLKDASVKLIALKARYEAEVLSKFGLPVIIFCDEPGLAGFGSSEFISISKEDVIGMLKEVFSEIREVGGIAGIHVCANTDWSLVIEAEPDIINFDAYGYFENFILFSREVKNFLEKDKIIAWGIVPTLKPEDIKKENPDSLLNRLLSYVKLMEKETNLSKEKILSNSLITPSCGLGSLSHQDMIKVLDMTKELSQKLKEDNLL